MNAFGITLFWLATQVTAVTLIAVLVLACTRHRGSRSVVTVMAAVQCLLVALTFLAFVPLPDAWFWTPGPAEPGTTDTERMGPGETGTNVAPTAEQGGGVRIDLATWVVGLRRLTDNGAGWPWRVVALVYLAGVLLGLVRLLLGWHALTRLRRASRVLDDASMSALENELRGELGCRTAVELRETDEPGLAATLGWRRPIILLPRSWRQWSETERRAVLAHELAHVCHRDFVLGLLAGVCRLLHFYHPLVRWLTGQFRWRQEVAADDMAAACAGGRTAYLKALARLALETPARKPAWASLTVPAMNGGAFLRRILMLRQSAQRPLSTVARVSLIAMLVGMTLFVSSWRAPAQSTNASARDASTPPFELGYIAPETTAIVAIRPSEVLSQPGMEEVCRALDGLSFGEATLADALKPRNIEQVVANLDVHTDGTGKPRSRSVMIGSKCVFVRFHKELDGPEVLKPWVRAFNPKGEGMKETRAGDLVIYRLGVLPVLGPWPVAMFMPDRRTMVFVASKDDGAAEACARRVATARERDWGSGRAKVERAPIAFLLDNTGNTYGKRFGKDLEPVPAVQAVMGHIRFAALGIELGDGKPVRVVFDAESAQAAKQIQQTVEPFLRLGLTKLKQGAEARPADKLARELIETHKVHAEGASQEWLGYSSVRIHQLLNEPLLPPD